MASIDLRPLLLSSTLVGVGSCAGRTPAVDDASGEDPGSETAAEAETTSTIAPEPRPDTDTGTGTDEVDGGCVPLAMRRVDHVAFDGDGCQSAVPESTVLLTQDEVDAHADAHCQSCSPLENCRKAPKLRRDTMMVYAFTGTPSSPADMEILSVEDCGDSVVVTALATSGHELALGTAWSTVTTPALAKPVEFEIDLVGPASASEQP